MADVARAALVVAADDFMDPKFQRLRSPATDVAALAEVLGDPDVGGFEVRTLVNEPGGRVQQELERFFSNRKPDDLLLLYFSCHGVKDPAGRLYFVSADTSFDLLRSTGISATYVSEQMEYSRSKRIVVLLDCCYSGAFLKGFRARGDDSVAVDQLEGRGRAVITASRATEYAFEESELTAENEQPSVFTGAIVDGLVSGRADTNGDGLVTVDELYDYVFDEVRGKVAGQTPGRWIDVEGDLVVARNPRPPLPPSSLPGELMRAVESDLALQRLGAVAELARLHREGQPGAREAATLVLEQLTADHDERVKAAAAGALAPPAAPQPESAASPVPAVAPVTSEPELPDDRWARAAGWIVLAGAVAVLLAPSFVHFRFGDYESSLSDRKWFTEGTYVLFVIAAFASYHLLRSKSRALGLAVLIGLLPAALAHGLIAIFEAADDKDLVSVGPGWLLRVTGLALMVAAGVVAACRYRTVVDVQLPTPGRPAVVTGLTLFGVLVVASLLTFGTAELNGITIDGEGAFDTTGPVLSLVIRLGLLTLAVVVGWTWLSSRGLPAKVLAGASGALLLVVVVLFVSAESMADFEELLVLDVLVVAMGGTALSAVAVLSVPRMPGAIALGTWALSSSVWLLVLIENEYDAGLSVTALVLIVLVAAALAVADRVKPVRNP
jgi:hypothetical protein